MRRDRPLAADGSWPTDLSCTTWRATFFLWCAPGPGLQEGRRGARGGSWAERDPALLEVAHRQFFAQDYRGRDVGFRVLREAAKEK